MRELGGRDELRKLNVPWITEDGCLDLNEFPIDSVLKQAMSKDESIFRTACRVLQAMHLVGRFEAGVFLCGLLAHNDDLARKEIIVNALQRVELKTTADLLFRELQNIVSSNTTKVYIKKVLRSLMSLPLPFIESGFEELIRDPKWSYRMKTQFRELLEEARYRNKR